MLDFTRRNLEYVREQLDTTATAGPRATATSSARGWARRSSTTPSTTSAACTTTRTWRGRPARRARRRGRGARRRRWRRASRTTGGSRPSGSTRTRSTTRATTRSTRSTGSASTRWRPSSTSTASSSPARVARARHRGARDAREQLLQRRAARQPGPVPHRLRRRADGRGRVRDLLAQHRHPGGGRGQLRPARRRAAAPLHGRQRGDAVLRAGDRRHAGRAAGRDAGDLPVRPRTGRSARRRTSTAAGPAARCSCRPGATTARPGRSSTSSSACGRTSATAGSRSSRRCRTGSRASQGANIRLGDGSVDVLAAHDGAPLHDRSTRATRRSHAAASATRCRAASSVASVVLDGRVGGFERARRTAGSRCGRREGARAAHAGGHRGLKR